MDAVFLNLEACISQDRLLYAVVITRQSIKIVTSYYFLHISHDKAFYPLPIEEVGKVTKVTKKKINIQKNKVFN